MNQYILHKIFFQLEPINLMFIFDLFHILKIKK